MIGRSDSLLETKLDPIITFVLGGARSGKSRYAESLVESAGAGLYLATAQTLDEEMETRVKLHKERRSDIWTTLEEPLNLAQAIADQASPNHMILVDCLTLWLSNLMEADKDIAKETTKLCATLQDAKGPVVLVSNEVGMGIVPENALARAFRDNQGRLNQEIAAIANKVIFVAAGLPIFMKDQA